MTATSSDRRKFRKILLSAYACHPTEGSEPGVGWAFLLAALETADEVHVLTRNNNVEAVLSALTADQLQRCKVHGYDLGRQSQIWKKRVPWGAQAYYIAWQSAARRTVRELHREHGFDVAHHVTFASDWYPVAASSCEGLPLVWGPVGGATSVPREMYKYLGTRGRLFELLRLVIGKIGRSLIGTQIARSASVMVASNQDVRNHYVSSGANIVVEPNAAISMQAFDDDRLQVDSSVVIGVGRLVAWKGWALALDAIASLPDKSIRFRLIGDGPDRRRLEARATRLGIRDRVEFTGVIPRSEVFTELRSARALLFPSFHDTAGWSVAEALSVGCPVVCLDLGGPAEIVRRSGGRIVPHRSPFLAEQLAIALSDPTPCSNVEAWSATRLPGHLSIWYSNAMTDVKI